MWKNFLTNEITLHEKALEYYTDWFGGKRYADITSEYKELTNFNVVMKYDLTPYLSGADFASTYQYMETYMKSYLSNQFSYEGVTLNIYDDNPYMAIEVAMDLEVIDEENYEEMQIGDIDKNVTISEFKKEFEEMDYMCE